MAQGIYRVYVKENTKLRTGYLECKNRDEAYAIACKHFEDNNIPFEHLVVVKQTDLICPKCSYKWSYCGYRTIYASCPQCMSQIKIAEGKQKIKRPLYK
jgi:Zn finger protein HypA/HybF involved in hydrogenase expression